MAKAIIYEHDGKSMKLTDWAKFLGINERTLYCRFSRGIMTYEDCFSMEVVKRKRVTIDLGIRTPFMNTETNEDLLIIKEQVCSWFGCHKKLSLQEKLFGNTCINHQ
jgi:hypothetical protein